MVEVALFIICVAVIFSSGYYLGKKHSSNITKDYLTQVAQQLQNNIVHDIRGGLNGIRNAIDSNQDSLVDKLDKIQFKATTIIRVRK